MRSVSILGSTGSIGVQALEVLAMFPDRYRVQSLAAGTRWQTLAEQALRFRPRAVFLQDASRRRQLSKALEGTGIAILSNEAALETLASDPDTDVVLAAMVGFAGLGPVLAAAEAGKRIALANKETLVVGGSVVTSVARRTGAEIIPVDSEHSAIFQCLVGEPERSVDYITLTASGGPFRTLPADRFDDITPDQALRHPNWSMGAKISIDSATMMNKGLEVIEARWVFDLEPSQIKVLVHPQSIIHSIVTFTDGSSKAQLGPPDMRVPIQYALTYPDRWPAPHPRIDWAATGRLDFELPDVDRFPSLRLAYQALEIGGTAPAVLNAANEEAVAHFLHDKIRFPDIPLIVEAALASCGSGFAGSLEALRKADKEAREFVREELKALRTN